MTGAIEAALQGFLRESHFATRGAVVTDLDGTVVHERQGRIYLPEPVELGLRAVYRAGRPVILNSLRFPLSVIRTFGREWMALAGAPIPLVSLNGAQIGYITPTPGGELTFAEIAAFPLTIPQIDEVMTGVEGLLAGNISEVLLFYYPRRWPAGEIIWTPQPGRVRHVQEKYRSAAVVSAVPLPELRERLLSEEICMIFLLIERAADQLMAYQHSRPSSFFTRQGVDKLFGAQALAAHLGVDLTHSVAAGDTPMDVFLSGVGLAVLVGGQELAFQGLHTTVRLADSFALGDFLARLAEFQQQSPVEGKATV